jgi:GT2 family glycosyltransferase
MTETKPKHSVLVLTYTQPKLLEARINELDQFLGHREDTEFVIFQNGTVSHEVTLVMGGESLKRIPDKRWKFESIKDNVGFGGGWNEAVRRSSGEKLFLLSDDVQVRGDFIEPIDKMASELTYGILIGQQMVNHKAGWNEFGPFLIPYLMGYFYAISRSTWDELGGFDVETFDPYDYEDVDLCYRATQANFSLIAIPELPIYHEVAGTIGYNPERFENTVLQRSRFAEKHGLPNVPERP